jgi:hypothetical protein
MHFSLTQHDKQFSFPTVSTDVWTRWHNISSLHLTSSCIILFAFFTFTPAFVQYSSILQAGYFADCNFQHWQWFKSRCASTKLVLIYILSICKISQLFTNSPFPTLLILFIAKTMSPPFFAYILSLQWIYHLSSHDSWVEKILGNYYYDLR